VSDTEKYKKNIDDHIADLFTKPETDFIKLFMGKADSSLSSRTLSPTSNDGSRKVLVVRHGERVDFTFGSWVDFSFSEDGTYIQKDLNMPESLHIRPEGISGWIKDTPLTNIGVYQGFLVGKSLKNAGLSAIFCSPAYRCIQTASAILEGAGIQDISINVEPGLFEWLSWYKENLPDFIKPSVLKELNFDVNVEYEPIFTVDTLKQNPRESLAEFYERNYIVSKKVTEYHFGNILVVGHGTNVETSTRFLMGRPMRVSLDLSRIMRNIPYCSLIAIEQDEESKNWKLVEPPTLPLTHTNNGAFDWNIIDT